MAAAVVDTAYLASYCSVPEPTVQTLLTNPTVDLVTALLQSIIVKAQDHDRLQSERLRLDVELENAIRNGESKTKFFEDKLKKAREEVATFKSKLNEEGQYHGSVPHDDPRY